MSTQHPDDQNTDKNAPYRSTRRAAQQGRTTRSSRSQRRIIVRSELRETPDVRKIARAIITMALVEAEREAKAQADQTDPAVDQESADE